MAIDDILPTNNEHQWFTVSGAINAVGFTDLTTFGANTVTTGGKLSQAGYTQIDGMINQSISDGGAAAGSITGRRILEGATYGPHFFLDQIVGTQTTTGDGMLATPSFLSPGLDISGDIRISGTPGVTDLGNGTATTSIRLSTGKPQTSLLWLCAEASSTASTDTLSDALTAFGGTTLFPYTVDIDNWEGIRAVTVAHTSDLGAGASTIGQFRFQGQGLDCAPPGHDLAGTGVGGEVAASSVDSRSVRYWDDWWRVRKGTISLLAGYTGTDSGTQSLAMGFAVQLKGRK